ncbi:T-cell surface antigen CD2 [Chionomys nivalis]|uniref:T-cell surface antigen CD2 n=1 Tax=Chionomys nivalis TaxID=269649 RepID=UPI002593E94A|nr:T-cell surface antigen CD2 [Chionomys nivalis]
MRCKFLTSFLLFFSISSKGAVSGDRNTIWGTLGHDVNLTIPNFRVTDTDDVRWEKGKILVAQYKGKTGKHFQQTEAFKVLKNGALQIKTLRKEDNDIYNVMVYGADGSSKLQNVFDLRVLERVSKPEISWECSNTTLICKVKEGTDLELKLYRGNKILTSLSQKILSHKWTSLKAPFKCDAKNKVSEESITVEVSCSEKGLHFYVIVGACAGGFLFVVLGALLTFCICKRRKQNRRRKDEELEIKPPRTSTMERGPKPYLTPAAAAQNPATSQVPPPPGHHLQTAGHRPLPPTHRTREHQQRKRPPPSGTQTHQQKGPPLPRPRVQPKPPSRDGEDAPLPPPS